MVFVDILGWLGSACVVYAYAMNMYGKLSSNSITYFTLNIVGSICLILNTYAHGAYPSMWVNIIWVALALVAWVKPKKG